MSSVKFYHKQCNQADNTIPKDLLTQNLCQQNLRSEAVFRMSGSQFLEQNLIPMLYSKDFKIVLTAFLLGAQSKRIVQKYPGKSLAGPLKKPLNRFQHFYEGNRW